MIQFSVMQAWMVYLFPSSSGTPSTCEEKAQTCRHELRQQRKSLFLLFIARSYVLRRSNEWKIISWLETGWNCSYLTVDFLCFGLRAAVTQISQSTQTWVLPNQWLVGEDLTIQFARWNLGVGLAGGCLSITGWNWSPQRLCSELVNCTSKMWGALKN